MYQSNPVSALRTRRLRNPWRAMAAWKKEISSGSGEEIPLRHLAAGRSWAPANVVAAANRLSTPSSKRSI